MDQELNKIHKPGVYARYIKRPLDFLCSLLGIIILSPIFLITAILVLAKLGSPVIFQQERPGKGGELFTLYKFRSMTNKRDKNGKLLPDDDRLTKFGRMLRSSSLDELPELFNIFIGDMSIVGPRPLLKEYLPYYTANERHRHDVRPGLTGLAQINGRNLLTWEEKFAYDLEYIRNITFLGDVKIILKTIKKVFKRSDVLVGKQFKVGRFLDQRADWILTSSGAIPTKKVENKNDYC